VHIPNRLPTLLAIVLAAPVSALPIQSTPALSGKGVTLRELDNGLRIVVKSEHATELVAIGLYVRAGTVAEQDWPDGISRFVEHLVFDGPDEGKAAKVREQLEILGGQLSSGVTRDFTHAHLAVGSQHLAQTLRLLAELVGDRTFPPTVVHDARLQLVRELRGLQRDPRAIHVQMTDRLWALAFERHPYGKALRGTVESISGITHVRAVDYYSQFYVPANMSLLVVGDTTAGEVVAATASTFGRIPRKDFEWQRPESEPEQTTARTDTILVGTQRNAFMMAFHGPGIDNAREVCAMDVIYTVLGQGKQGRLVRALEDEQKVAVSTDVEFITRRDPGLVIISCVATEGKEREAREGVLDEIRRLTDEPLRPGELAAAKKLLRDAYAFSNETLGDQTGSMGFYESIDTYKFAIDYIDQVNKVTAKDVQRTAARYLRPDAYTLVVARSPRRPTPRPTREGVNKASL